MKSCCGNARSHSEMRCRCSAQMENLLVRSPPTTSSGSLKQPRGSHGWPPSCPSQRTFVPTGPITARPSSSIDKIQFRTSYCSTDSGSTSADRSDDPISDQQATPTQINVVLNDLER